HRLRALVSAQAGGLDDAELLHRFAARRDEAAFEVLVWRYGPLVARVGRRLLRHEQDAEDVFQATFLTLARKAGSVAKRASLAAWLHQVAFRIALRARAAASKRRVSAGVAVESQPAPPTESNEWRAVLDEEILRLPARYRTAFVACYLEGKTNAEAAATW